MSLERSISTPPSTSPQPRRPRNSAPLVHIQSLTFSYPGADPVLRDVSLSVHAGDVVALAGANGSGKSTLVGCLAGQLQPIRGSARAPKEVAVLPQELVHLRGFDPAQILWRPQGQLGELVLRLRRDDAWDALADFAELGGYAREQQLRDACEAFGLPPDWAQALPEVATRPGSALVRLSPGQRQHLELAAVFATSAPLLILDEPSNHLDLEATARLEQQIQRVAEEGRAVLLISHDRHLIDAVADRTAFLEGGSLVEVAGGWTACLTHRQQLADTRAHEARQSQRRIRALESEVRERSAWAARKEASKRGAGASKPHIAKQAKKMNRRAQDKQKRLDSEIERLRAEAPRRHRTNRLAAAQQIVARRGVAQLESVSFRHRSDSPWLLRNVDLHLDSLDRIALCGPNGGGKSTLLGLLTGDFEPSHGSVRRTAGVQIARLRQDLDGLFTETTLLQSLRAQLAVERWDESEVRTHLATVGLRRERALAPCSDLSFGERMRAALALLVLQRPDFLILDEPTNHLDIEMVEVLERILLSFPGGFLLVSHDRRLVETVSERRIELEGGRLTESA